MSEVTVDGIPAGEIEAALERVLAARPLDAAPQAAAMLRHVVGETLAGRGAAIKAYSIGVDALGRPKDFDPQTDPGVRVLARSLRQSLTEYYAGEGASDPVRIELPTGRYEPKFVRSAAARPVRRARPGLALAASSALALAAIALAGWLLWRPAGGLDLPRVARFEGPRLLIQPFAHEANEVAEDLAVGLSAELVADMSQYPWLSVIQIPGEQAGMGRLAEHAAGIDPPHYILSGKVDENAGMLAVSVTLQSFPRLRVKWTNVFREPLDSAKLERLQYEISKKIAALVGSENGILPELIRTNPPAALSIDVEAFRCFMEIHAYWKQPGEALHRRLGECLPQAVARNPGYAEAWAALAYVRMDEARLKRNPRPGADPWAEADAAIARALEISPLSPVVLRTAMIHAIEKPQPDLAAFERHGRRNLELRPNNPHALAEFGSRLAVTAGDWSDGMRFVARAFDLNPSPPGWYYFAPAMHALLDGDEGALAAAIAPMEFPERTPMTLLRAIAAYHAGDAGTTEAMLRELAQLGVTDMQAAMRDIDARGFAPDLKARLKQEAAALFAGRRGLSG